jgi:hypothetical protein
MESFFLLKFFSSIQISINVIEDLPGLIENKFSFLFTPEGITEPIAN